MENTTTRYLKRWLGLPKSATCAVLYYPGMCCPSISQVSRQAWLSLLSCIDASSDYQLQELGLQLHLGDAYLQTHASDYSILSEAHSQLTSFPMARQLYLLSKKLIAADECSCYNKYLDTLSVQCKLKDSVSLESCCGTWNRLLLGCNPGHISFVLELLLTLFLQQLIFDDGKFNVVQSVHCVAVLNPLLLMFWVAVPVL